MRAVIAVQRVLAIVATHKRGGKFTVRARRSPCVIIMFAGNRRRKRIILPAPNAEAIVVVMSVATEGGKSAVGTLDEIFADGARRPHVEVFRPHALIDHLRKLL